MLFLGKLLQIRRVKRIRDSFDVRPIERSVQHTCPDLSLQYQLVNIKTRRSSSFPRYPSSKQPFWVENMVRVDVPLHSVLLQKSRSRHKRAWPRSKKKKKRKKERESSRAASMTVMVCGMMRWEESKQAFGEIRSHPESLQFYFTASY